MHFTWNTITFINFVFSLVIFIFGLVNWQRMKSKVVLYVAVAFGLFSLSHLASLFNLTDTLYLLLIIIRIVAYLLVINGFFLAAHKENNTLRK